MATALCDRTHAELVAGRCPWCGQAIFNGELFGSIWEDIEKSLREFMTTQGEFTKTEDQQHSGSLVDSLGADSPPIIRLFDLLVDEAILLGVARVLITPHEESVPLHFEIDDQLIERDVLSRDVYQALLERIKSLYASGQVRTTLKEYVIDAEFQNAEFGEIIMLAFNRR